MSAAAASTNAQMRDERVIRNFLLESHLVRLKPDTTYTRHRSARRAAVRQDLESFNVEDDLVVHRVTHGIARLRASDPHTTPEERHATRRHVGLADQSRHFDHRPLTLLDVVEHASRAGQPETPPRSDARGLDLTPLGFL